MLQKNLLAKAKLLAAVCAVGVIIFGGAAAKASSPITGCRWVSVGAPDFSVGGIDNVELSFNKGKPYVVYESSWNNNQITVMSFNGTSWQQVGDASTLGNDNWYPVLGFNSKDTPYIAYDEGEHGVTVASFNGKLWQVVGNHKFSNGSADYIDLAFNGDNPYVAYTDKNSSGEVGVKFFDGTSWQPMLYANPYLPDKNSNFINLVIDNGQPYVAYSHETTAQGVATIKTISGTKWVDYGNPDFSDNNRSAEADYLNFVFDNSGVPYVAYTQSPDCIRVVTLKNGKWADVDTSISCVATGRTGYSHSLTVENGIVYLAYMDDVNGGKAKVVAFDGKTWQAIGDNQNFSPNDAWVTGLIFNKSIPYVAYKDMISKKANVMACVLPKPCDKLPVGALWNGASNYYGSTDPGLTHSETVAGTCYYKCDTASGYQWDNNGHCVKVQFDPATCTWQNLGTPDFSAAAAAYPDLVFNLNTPYVAYRDDNIGSKATVKKYNADTGHWDDFGAWDFSAGQADWVSLAFDASQPFVKPYVAYEDYVHGHGTTVMKYDSGSWTPLGTPGFSQNLSTLQGPDPAFASSIYQALAYNQSDQKLYVAYADSFYSKQGSGNRASLARYNGTAWEAVGPSDFSSGSVSGISLAFDSVGTPYVAYTDLSNNHKATVMKYYNQAWVLAGDQTALPNNIIYTNLVLDNGTLYFYTVAGVGGKPTVLALKNNVWTIVSSYNSQAAIQPGQALAFYNHQPSVVLADLNNGTKATVANNNQTIGSSGFSVGAVGYAGLAWSDQPDAQPYVIYQDRAKGDKATVMTCTSAVIPPTDSCGGQINYTNSNIVFDKSDPGGTYIYHPVKIGDQCWLKENLNIGTSTPGNVDQTNNKSKNYIEKYCYNNDPANCLKYGGLYQWNEAMGYSTTEGAQGICPDGWHVPSSTEWRALQNYLEADGQFSSGAKLKASPVNSVPWDGMDKYGFTALPAGSNYQNFFSRLGDSTFYPSSNLNADGTVYAVDMLSGDTFFSVGAATVSTINGNSVRCIKGQGDICPNGGNNSAALAKNATIKADVYEIQMALKTFFDTHGYYPINLSDPYLANSLGNILSALSGLDITYTATNSSGPSVTHATPANGFTLTYTLAQVSTTCGPATYVNYSVDQTSANISTPTPSQTVTPTPTPATLPTCLPPFPVTAANVRNFTFGSSKTANPVAWFYDCTKPTKACSFCCNAGLIYDSATVSCNPPAPAVQGVKIHQTWWQNILQWLGL